MSYVCKIQFIYTYVFMKVLKEKNLNGLYFDPWNGLIALIDMKNHQYDTSLNVVDSGAFSS